MTTFAPSPMDTLIDVPVRYDLAESTNPALRLVDLADPAELADLALGYGTTRGDAELRALVAADAGVDADRVLVTVGAIEAMFLLAQAVCGPGDRVLVATPCFPPARTVPEGLGAPVDVLRLSFDEGYRLPLDRLAAALTPRTRLVSVASPQNPAGVRFTDEEVRALVATVAERAPEAVVLVDETYRASTYGGPPPPSAAGRAAHVVTTASLSKAYGTPGLRLGWLTATDPVLYDRLRSAKFHTTIACSTVDEFLAVRVLRRSSEILAATGARLRAALDELRAWAAAHDVELIVPDGGPLCCLRLPAGTDPAAFHARLAARGARVAPGPWFGGGEREFRVGFGYLPPDDFTAALDRLADALGR